MRRATAGAALSVFGAPISAVSMDDLALEVGERDRVVVDDADLPDAGGGEILDTARRARPRRSPSTFAAFSLLLAGAADRRASTIWRR
ncbi:MAG: hypothetical protein QM757_01875 [Paludibaculum sp.]